ncbi:MAG: sigma-54-dependent Fis family transcriptional regulator [Spirochaetia bacterium]|nr:sigma-54-dependent Fis family transcriptional regulator [Spirochaetia bacterium]
MVRILIVCRRRTLFTKIQASIKSIVFYYAATVEEGEFLSLSAYPDLVCIALAGEEQETENFQNLQTVSRGKRKIPVLYLLEKDFNGQTAGLQGRNSFIITGNQFNAENFITSVFALIYKNQNAAPLYKISDHTAKALPELTRESICDPGAYAESFLVGTSSAMQFVRKNLCKFAPYPDKVLILGESGTGKELAAKILHNLSGRSGPFIAINCAVFSQSLAESELFGYEKGAFTDAKHDHIGVFEQAHKGTLFLDEVGEMQGNLQPKLLRILENDTIVRLGSSVQRKINVRILSATNAHIDFTGKNSTIRKDLLFRLSTLSIYIPPLRERREDIASLSDWFLSRQNLSGLLSEKSLLLLTEYNWPGNVRQLFGVLRKAIIYSDLDLCSKKKLIEITPSMFNPKAECNLHTACYHGE